VEAAYSLQTLHYLEREPGRALEVNEWLHARFPGNPVGLYHRALILERLHRGEDALGVWDRLVERIQTSGRVSEGFLAECELQRSRGLAQAGRTPEAKLALGQASFHARRRNPSEELEGPFVPFDDIRQAIADAAKTPGTERTADGPQP
jgi:hypothetical protein